MLEEEEGRPFIRRALELGINFFDTADMYSLGVSEEILGRALRDFGPGRDRVVIATKVFDPMGEDPNQKGLSRKHILHAIDDSLRRLGTDYVDLYQIHRFDYETPIEETLAALETSCGPARPVTSAPPRCSPGSSPRCCTRRTGSGCRVLLRMQNHYNLIYREEEREMIPLCRKEGIGIIPWSPLARGFLAGNRSPKEFGETVRAKTDEYAQKMYYQPSDFTVVERLTAIAQRRGLPNAQVALAWLLSKPGVTAPIVGASRMKHLDDAIAALSLKLDESEIRELEAPYQPHGILGHF